MRKIALLTATSLALASCEQPTEPPVSSGGLRRVIKIAPLADKYIELDDGARYGMGENLYNRLVTRLQISGKFVVVVDEPWRPRPAAMGTLAEVPSDRLKFDFAPVPAASFTAAVESLTFSHGSRGVRRFAGYSPEFTTPFNDGRLENQNEYPPRSLDFVDGWFGTSFAELGTAPVTTIAGVDAGEEGEFNVQLAKVNYRRDSYYASAQVRGTIRMLADATEREHVFDAKGTGFLFALGAGYKELSAEFGLARRDALKKTFDQAVEKMATELERQLFALPFRTRIEQNGKEGIILNAGRREGVSVGDVFSHKAAGKVSTLKVVEVFEIGSRAEFVDGGADVMAGDVVVHAAGAAPKLLLAAATEERAGALLTEIPDNREASVPGQRPKPGLTSITLDPPEFHDPDGNVQKGFLGKGLLLPYYLLRWTQYDQELDAKMKLPARGDIYAAAAARWNLGMIQVAAAWRRGLSGTGVKVAVIDSGVDYNHKNLAAAVNRQYAGFDFMSHDLRPFDDNSHGTAVAGLIGAQAVEKNQVGVAPGAQLLSYKVFNPYGETTSAALYGAFARAIADGAKVIVCAWDTRRESQALAEAVALAEAAGVLVVAAAGDQGEDIRARAHYPAAYNRRNNLITVAALDKTGALATVSGRHSNHGLEAVDIAAPGAELEVLAPRSDYLTRSGTDLAAAHVAGVAALVWEKHPAARAETVKDILLQTAAVNPRLAGKVTGQRALDADAATR